MVCGHWPSLISSGPTAFEVMSDTRGYWHYPLLLPLGPMCCCFWSYQPNIASYQPDPLMVLAQYLPHYHIPCSLSGLYRTYCGLNRYTMWETNQNYTYRLYISLIALQRWWECKRWEDVWIRLIVFQLSTRGLLYRPLGRHTSPWLLLWGCAAHPIMFSGAHFLPSVAKCFASLCQCYVLTFPSSSLCDS